MILFLKIIAVVALLAVFAVIVGIAFLIRWLRKVIKVAAREAASAASSCPPCRVHPEPLASPQWNNPEKVQQYANEYKALGFHEIGAFTIPELEGLQILAFTHSEEQVRGVIYDRTKTPTSFDICCDFENGTSLSASSSAMGRGLDERPHDPILWVGIDQVAAVLDALKQKAQSTPRVPISAEEFLPHFKRSYAKGMNWRMKKGGISREEIRRRVEIKGKPVDEEVIDETYKRMRKGYVAQLTQGCLAQYLDDSKISAADWERIQARAIVIPETFELAELIEILENTLTLDQEQRHALGQLRKHNTQTALEITDEILAKNLAGLGLEKHAEVSEPVRAYILLSPPPEEAATVSCA